MKFQEYFEAAARIIAKKKSINKISSNTLKKRGRKPKKTTVGIRNIANRYEKEEKEVKRVFKKIYQKALDQYGDEGRAIATAYSVLHKKFSK